VTSGNQVRIDDGDSQPDFYYCDIEGGQAEFGGAGFYGDYLYNIDEDPIFMGEPSDHPFMITEGSACIDAGTSDTSQWYSPQYLPETCLAGNPRIYNGRIDIGACEYDPVMSVGEPAVLNHPVTVYPNPFRENLLISINLERSADVKMQVYNTSGSLIASYEYGNMQAGSYLQTWNASAFPEGIYYCRVQIGIQTVTKKIIKMR